MNHVIRLFAICLLAGSMVRADSKETSAEAKPKKPEAPATHTISRGTLKGKVPLDAVVESLEMIPLKLEPKAWNELIVLEAVPHGAKVKKGQTLVKLDTEKLREQIEDLVQDQPASKIARESAQAELQNLEQTTPLKLESAKRAHRVANEDLDYFEKTSRAQREKNTRFGVKSSEQRLANAKEELAQLEKMYRADDLVEETEEIVVKRQRFEVDAAELGLEGSKLNADWSLNTGIPREAENFKSAKRDQDLAVILAEQSIPRSLTRKRLEVEKMGRDQKKTDRRLADLQNDLSKMEITSPAEGLVYYGACENGRWPTGAVLAKKLIPSGRLAPTEVFMTVVNPEKIQLRAVISESDLAKLKAGMKGEASPVSAPGKKLAVKLEDVGWVPLPTGGFDARLSLTDKPDTRLAPGMNCKVSFDTSQKSVLLAPKEAVFADGDQKFVYLAKRNGSNEKRDVKAGDSDDKSTVITEGLSEGDKILLKRPE